MSKKVYIYEKFVSYENNLICKITTKIATLFALYSTFSSPKPGPQKLKITQKQLIELNVVIYKGMTKNGLAGLFDNCFNSYYKIIGIKRINHV